MCVYHGATVDTQDEELPWEAAVPKKTLDLNIFRKSCCNIDSGHDTTVGSQSIPPGEEIPVVVSTGLVLSSISLK